jgi:predicted nucleic-acid-binding protein
VKITPDSNVLLRAVLLDDAAQGLVAVQLLQNAETISVTLPTLCEFVWVLRQGRKIPADIVASRIRELVASSRVQVDRAAVDFGLAMLDAGGDFADGVIAFEGNRLGGETFVTFDRDAAGLLATMGIAASLLPISAI